MSFADIIRQGVQIADALTVDLQVTVTHQAWIGQDGSGKDAFNAPVNRKALVDRAVKPMLTKEGKLIIVLATVTFLDPIPNTTPNANQQRINPIDPRDIITLDDGSTAPIQKCGGFEDAGTLSNFVNEVVLGNI